MYFKYIKHIFAITNLTKTLYMAFTPQKINPEEEITTSLDRKVVFDPIKHKYYYGEDTLLSVTQFIKKFTKPFNALFPSIAKSKKNLRMKTGITNPIKLRKYWRLNSERASNLGTSAHVFAEMYVMDRTTKPITGYDHAAIKAIHWLEQKFEFISQEEVLYNTNYLLAGSCDLIMKDRKTGEYAAGDWKTTVDMFKTYNKLLTPFDNLKDSAINKYSIQLDTYSLLANQYIPEPNRYVIQLLPSGEFNVFYPGHPDKLYQLPYTLDKTKEAISIHIKQHKKK